MYIYMYIYIYIYIFFLNANITQSEPTGSAYNELNFNIPIFLLKHHIPSFFPLVFPCFQTPHSHK